MLVFSIILSLTGANYYLVDAGIDYGALLIFCAVVGFSGSIISLLLSKTMAKIYTGAKVIKQPRTEEEIWLMETVGKLASRAGLPMPEVAVYEGAPNAFATGATKSSSLVAVSSGLMQSLNRQEVEAVLAHEISHVANGDMVTLTLIQGVVNTFVVYLSRVVAWGLDRVMQSDNDSKGPGFGYYISSIVFELVFGILASMVVMYFSRQREFRADAGAGKLMGNNQYMINALKALSRDDMGALPKEMAASGIGNAKGLCALFSTHPPMEARIAALEKGVVS